MPERLREADVSGTEKANAVDITFLDCCNRSEWISLKDKGAVTIKLCGCAYAVSDYRVSWLSDAQPAVGVDGQR